MTSLRLATALVLASVIPSVASAEPLPLERRVHIGRPAREAVLRVSAAERGTTLTVETGGRTETATLPVVAAGDASIDLVEVAAGHHVAIVRATAGGERAAALVTLAGGRAQILWTGRLDLHGDPGERTADVLSLDDRTGDGRPDVVVGMRREGASLCGQEETLLFPRAFDPQHGSMRPVALRRLPANGEERTVTATRESPGPTGRPLLASLSFSGASSTAGHAEDASALGPPRELGDGDPTTFWAEGRGGAGSGEFVVARFDARVPIRAVAVTAASGAAGASLGRPRTFWIVGDGGARVRVTMPEDAGLHAGERYWITLPEPATWRCVGLVLDEAYAPPSTRDAAVHTGLGELEVYTDLDFGGGVEQLVSVLVEGREGGDEAARLLSGLGAPAVHAVAEAWDRLSQLGRRRAVRVFVEGARRGADEGIAALARAARDDDESVRDAALQALGTLGPEAGEQLAALVREPGSVGDAAVRPLLRHAPAVAVGGLLAALSAEGGSERPTVREALPVALSRGDDGAERAFEDWRLTEPALASRASAALGLARSGATRSQAAQLLASAIGTATRFEDRWRLVGAARQLPSDPEVDAWLAATASDAEEWMLRAAAIEALGRRDAERRVDAATSALHDAYPRVRTEAIRVLDSANVDDDALAQLAREDSWPMVREAAVEALWDRPAGRDTVRRAVRDRSARVRHAAIGALARARDREAWPLVRARLADDQEWPQVTVAALHYVRDLCMTEASELLVGVIRRGLRPSPWQPDVDVAAVAVDLALVLGGPAADEARRLADRPDAPASMRAALTRRLATPAQCH